MGNKFSGGRANDLTGRRFGSLVAIRRALPSRRVTWWCQCDCGNMKAVDAGNLTAGYIKTCAACPRQRVSDRPEYTAFQSAKQRCLNPHASEYRDYGGRGITIDPAWVNDFQAFLDHVGPRPTPQHTLDRIDNNGHYEPGNVRWATKSEQQLNRRVGLGLVRLNEDGTEEPISLGVAASYLAMSYSALRMNFIAAGVLKRELRG